MVQSHLGAVRYIILKILLLLGGVRSIYPRRLNKGFGSLLPHTYQMLPDEGRRLQRPKRCINNNQDEDNPNNTTHKKLIKCTYLVTHEELASAIAHAQSPFHEGHNSVHGVHVSPLHVVLEK